jgi:hypothetical protein
VDKNRPSVASVVQCLLAALVFPERVLAQAWSPASAEERCPSRWGAADDIYRRADGKIAEHWDVTQEVPTTAANPNGVF